MPVSQLHREVAAIALRAASGHGFALGGGNALIAHGLIDRPTGTSISSPTRNAVWQRRPPPWRLP
jgi:hypothetical protein